MHLFYMFNKSFLCCYKLSAVYLDDNKFHAVATMSLISDRVHKQSICFTGTQSLNCMLFIGLGCCL